MPSRKRLNKAAVVESAAELVQTEGLAALSLNRLAARLQVQTPSLYNHIDGLPGLYRELALLSIRTLGDCMAGAAVGKAGVEAIGAIAQAYRTYIKESPGLYEIGLRTPRELAGKDPELETAAARVVQVALTVVASFGLTGDDAIHAVRGLRSLVHGFATLEVAGGFGIPLDCDESFHRMVDMFIRGMQYAGERMTPERVKRAVRTVKERK